MWVQHYFDERGLDERVSHVVVMGIGEPFDNYANVMNFYERLMMIKLGNWCPPYYSFNKWFSAKIREFADSGLQVNLAISLHAPNNEVRTSIMRINRSFPIEN